MGNTSKCIVQCAAGFGIVFLVILNAICLLLGIGMIVIAALLRKEVDKHEDIMNFLDEVDLGDTTVRDIVTALITLVIIVGVFTIVTSLLGGVGAMCQIRIMLGIYAVIVLVCIVLESVALKFWINLLQGANEWLLGQFTDLLKKYAGPLAKDLYSLGWNLVFILFGCCGVLPTSSTHNDFQTLNTEWWVGSSRGSDVIPESCCKGSTEDNYLNYTNPQCTQQWQDYHTSGCYDVFTELFTRLAEGAISITTLLIIVEVAAIVFSILIIYNVTKRRSVSIV